jgi:pyruvate formate lyase activating enzyme
MKLAKYYRKLQNEKVICELCPRYCVINHNETGTCRARQNSGGELYTLNYGKTVSIHLDPIEKKPLYHFFPGSIILSIGANSCNLTCQFCQNYSISQFEASTYEITKEQLLTLCRKYNCNMLAFTYTEPATWFEFMLESAIFLKENGIKIVSVTNGFINEEPLLELLPYLDAMNIDLKSMNPDFYETICGGKLEPVLKSIELAAKHTHLEVTNLVISGSNDSQQEMDMLIDFMGRINPNIPVHFSKYYPAYQFSAQPTSEKSLLQIYDKAKSKLHHVYLGNMIFDNNTYCSNCKALLVSRKNILVNRIVKNTCPDCGKKVYGRWG